MQHGHGMNSQTVDMFNFSYEQAREMNIRFAHAMIAARESGAERRENITYGPKLDRTAMVPKHYDFEPCRSGMTSSAAVCADDLDSRVAI